MTLVQDSFQDGVVYHENKLIPGAKEMVAWLQKEGKEFLFLTNSSDKTPKDLKYKLSSFGIYVVYLQSCLCSICSKLSIIISIIMPSR